MDAWPIWDIFLVLALPNIVRFKALDGEQVVGFVVAEKKPFQRMAWIATFGVDPTYRNLGIGSALMKAIEDTLRVNRIRLSVRITNETAIRLYRRFGYDIVSTWPRYYKGGEDALIMEKEIK